MDYFDDFHIGDIIKQELGKQERTEAWLARKIACDAGNLNRQLRNKHLPAELLAKITIALQINLFARYSHHISKNCNFDNNKL